MDSEVITIYGNMDWFRVSEQPSESDIPQAIKKAKALLDKDGGGNNEEIVKIVSPFVNGLFIADNLGGWEDFLVDDTYGEFSSKKVQVTGVDFAESPIPLCRVEAWFDLRLKPGVVPQRVL